MQTVAVARGRGGPRTTLRTVVLGGLLALSVIIGLLTMCTLNAQASAVTHELPLQTISTQNGHPSHEANAGHQATPSALACDDCGTTSDDGHLGMAMACVMALLAFLVLLPRPRRSRFRIIQIERAVPVALGRSLAHRQPPSLHVLCISRT